jgi:Gas vesicle synthesis protein GvpO
MAERRSARTTRHDDDYEDELADSTDDEFADRDAGLTAAQAARTAQRHITALTGKQPEGVTGVEPAEYGWVVGVEVVEDRRIPSSSDILAAYETALDMDGELLSYRRVRRYPRGRTDQGI